MMVNHHALVNPNNLCVFFRPFSVDWHDFNGWTAVKSPGPETSTTSSPGMRFGAQLNLPGVDQLIFSVAKS